MLTRAVNGQKIHNVPARWPYGFHRWKIVCFMQGKFLHWHRPSTFGISAVSSNSQNSLHDLGNHALQLKSNENNFVVEERQLSGAAKLVSTCCYLQCNNADHPSSKWYLWSPRIASWLIDQHRIASIKCDRPLVYVSRFRSRRP